MVSVFRKLWVLTWKCLILRKRNWLLSLFEMICPLLVMFGAYKLNAHVTAPNIKEEEHTISQDFTFYPPTSIFETVISARDFAYTPTNEVTDAVMEKFKKSEVKDKNGLFTEEMNIKPVISEDELEIWLKNQYVEHNRLSVGIVFLDANITARTYKYKIRSTSKDFFTDITKDYFYTLLNNYELSSFLGVQILLDKVLLNISGCQYDAGERLIGGLPVRREAFSIVIFLLYLFLMMAYVFLVASIMRDVVQEKASGIKELMKIMGVSSWMIWVHWLLYTLIIHLPVTVGVTVFLTVLSPPVIAANAFIVWMLFFLFMVTCIVMLFMITCIFNSPFIGTIVCVFGWLGFNCFILTYIGKPDEITFILQLAMCLNPLANLCWALGSISSFKDNGIQWTMGHLFTRGLTGSYVSVGLAMIIFLLESLMFVVILMFLDAIKPGPYGVAKPITFVCHWCRSLWKDPTEPWSRASTYFRRSLPKTFEPAPKDAKVGIMIRGLRKCFGRLNKVTAVENVDLDIYKGEIMALLGHNGAGKTTTMSMITGMFSPTQGIIVVDGIDICRHSSRFRDSLGLCTQHNMFFAKLTVIEHLIFFGMLKGMPYSVAKEEGLKILNLLELNKKKNSMVSKLSGGMIRRLCLAISLAGKPKVLILDEPTSGLDPETRREVWNIILSLREERTIVITTHFMEEADVLGDRIAIMDHGQVVCCGTSMFLKNLYGTGYNLHVLTKPKTREEDITHYIEQYVPNPKVKVVSPTQIDYSIGKEHVERFPSLFALLERNGQSSGITGISVTCTTMEDVFLKVLQNRIDEESDADQDQMMTFTSNITPLLGLHLKCQRIKTLIWKRYIYLRRSYFLSLLVLILSSLILLSLIRQSHYQSTAISVQRPLEISLAMYPGSINPMLYDYVNKKAAMAATNIIKTQNGKIKTLSNNTNLNDYLVKLALEDIPKYKHKTLLALSFIKGNFTLLHQKQFYAHLPAISANIMANIVLRNSSDQPSGSVEAINHPYTLPSDERFCSDTYKYMIQNRLMWMLSFFCALVLLMSKFIALPIEDRASGFKHQQIMAGVSPLLYWISNFAFDYLIYLCIIIIYILVILIFGRGFLPLDSVYMCLLILVLVLHGVSGLSFVYLFTYLVNNKNISYFLYSMFNLVFGLSPVFLIFFNVVQHFGIFLLVTILLSFNPTFCATIAIGHLAAAITDEYLCRVCKRICKDDDNPILKFPTDEDRTGILMYVLFLGLVWIPYSILIIAIDWGIVRKIYFMLFHKEADFSGQRSADEDVRKESDRVALFKGANVDSVPLRVERLVKKYFLGPLAVNKISFLVTRGECFGLLGVNGAGKSTAFKVLTSDIYPNSGDAYITQYSVLTKRRKYLSLAGYCPQFDAILTKLTGKEMLKIIAKLRGIPCKNVEEEVKKWLDILGISEHGEKRSGAYSGGTKRKLSTAMAFIGDPMVVFLDEPTTGVDPMSRRKLWTVVQDRQRAGQAIVLTSHSMEECEALCTRLTIMSDGEMQCIGTIEYLKNKFGKGYTVLIKLIGPTEERLVVLKRAFSEVFPMSEINDEHATLIQYHVLDQQIPLSQLFSKMLRLKEVHNIVEEFSISNTTLEQVFLSFASKKRRSQ